MRTYSLRNLVSWLNSLNRSILNNIWQRTISFKALIAILWDLQPLWSSSLTKPDLLRFRCSSEHVLSKTKSVTPHFFYISGIANSSSFNGKIFRKKSMLEKFRANVLKSTRRKKINFGNELTVLNESSSSRVFVILTNWSFGPQKIMI